MEAGERVSVTIRLVEQQNAHTAVHCMELDITRTIIGDGTENEKDGVL